jgi:hypothetical protein
MKSPDMGAAILEITNDAPGRSVSKINELIVRPGLSERDASGCRVPSHMVAGCNSYTLLIYEPYDTYVLDSFYISLNPTLNMDTHFKFCSFHLILSMLSNIIQLKEVGLRNVSFMAKSAKCIKISIQLLLYQP